LILFNNINTHCVGCIRHTIHSEHIQFYTNHYSSRHWVYSYTLNV